MVVTPKDGELNALRLLNMPERIFPGLSIELCVELTAEYPNNSSFDMKLSQNFNDETCESVVEATVVTVETFKHVKKSLQLQKRPIYRPNVSVAGNCASYFEERSSTTPTTVSEIVLDDDDIDEMLEYPFAPNVFWDPFSKLLRVDPQLSKVCFMITISHCYTISCWNSNWICLNVLLITIFLCALHLCR